MLDFSDNVLLHFVSFGVHEQNVVPLNVKTLQCVLNPQVCRQEMSVSIKTFICFWTIMKHLESLSSQT